MMVMQVEKLYIEGNNMDIREISRMMNTQRRELLLSAPWHNYYPYSPEVAVAVAHSCSCLLLKYYVREKEIRAVNNVINGSVWEDSCVEFFISLHDGAPYYNFEFNCIGTALVGYGFSNRGRTLLHEGDIRKINTLATIRKQGGSDFEWELTAAIPAAVFIHQPGWTFEGMTCKGNFYKCGDSHKQPHFLTWSAIESAQPNFHQPDFFGDINFQ